MSPYIPKANERAREQYEIKLRSAQMSKNSHLIDKYSKILQGLDEQITNRENVYYNREVFA